MSTKKNVKCKICGKKYVSKAALIEHLGKAHSSSIPKDWSPARFENYLRTGKTEGHCVYCKKETTWNETTGKYNRMCGSEACKKKARELANKNYIGVHGKPYSINDPEQQKKMIYGRKNSGTYIFEDEYTGKKYKAMYDSSYGKDFLEMIDTFLNWDGADIIAPSPNTYWYEYEGKKHFYIPDVYSTSLNLEIELKDGGDNPNNHPKIQAVDKVKEEKKDAVMESLKDQVNYIKICNKDYTEFFALLSRLKEKDVCQLPKWQSRLESITESCVTEEVDQQKIDRAKTFSYYHLEEKKKDYSWDEEQYYKNIDDSIKDKLYNLANSETGEKEGKQSFYVYTMGKEYSAICLGKITVRWFDFYDKDTPKYDYEWEETFGINKALIDEEINPITESSPLNPASYIRRNHKLTHPMLNYDDLIDYYRKQLFHKRLKPLEWQALYNELIGVKEYLQRVSNETGRPDNRMAYESRNALKEIEGFIQYMEQKNEDNVMESSFNMSNKVPIYIVSWNYGSFVGNMVRLATGSTYNHTSIALTSDLEDCYTFSRNPETTNSRSTNGFCRESLSYMVNRFGDCTIKVDAVYISKSNYKKLQNIINEYKKHESDTSFDYINFARILFNIEKEDLDENKLNCSVFTDLVLKKSGIDVTNGKSSNLVTPSDLSNLDKTNKNVVTVYTGLASKYNSNLNNQSEHLTVDKVKSIVKKIASKTKMDEKPPVGNQNCQICTWCLEAQIRGYDVLPRPVYSPRDIIFTMNGYDIVKGAEKISIGSFKDVDTLIRSNPNSRYYVHVNWKNSSSGHEFVVMNIDGKPYVVDGQDGIVVPIRSSKGMRYFNNANYKNSYMVRMDNKEFKESVLDFNDEKYILDWKDDDVKLLESMDIELTYNIVKEEASNLDKNFKKKSGKQFEYKSLSPNTDKYLKDNSYWKKYGKYHKENSVGEIAIDKDTDELAGYIFVKNKRSGEEGFITPLEVLPKYRGYGVSNELIDDAIHKYGAIDLTVDIDNEVAINLYKKHGFVIIGYENEKTKKRYYMKLRSKLSKDETIISENHIDSCNNPLSTMGDNIMEGSIYNQKGLDDIIRFNAQMNVMEYIIPNDGNIIYKVTSDDFINRYRVLTPNEFKKWNGGVCWDYVVYEADYFKKHFKNVKFETYFHCFIDGKTNPTHTFLLFYLNGKVYWFESSWKSHVGVWEFANKDTALSFIVKELYKDLDHKPNKQITIIYDALSPNMMGMGCVEYMEYMNSQKEIHYKTINNPKPSNYYRGEESFDITQYATQEASLSITKSLKMPKDESIISESTYIEGIKDNTKYYPVFIFLSYTDTNMAKLIKSFTHDPYAHSSISFDTELNHMISFNREGMVEENINEKIWKKNKDRIKYSLYMYMASVEEYESMRNFVNELLGRRSKLRYNALGLTNFIFGRGSEREDKYFCSEFVASVISAGNTNIIKTRPYMTSPYMLAKNKNFKFIKKGILKNYNSKVVDNLVKDILEERGFEDVTIK